MSKNSYWEKRKVQDMFYFMEQSEKRAEELSQLYLKASRYISIESEQIFEKYKTKHGLTDESARVLLNTLQDKASLEQLKEALRSGKSDKTKAELLALLESPAYQARLERLKQLQNQLDIVMNQVYQQEKAVNTNHYLDLANEAYYRSIFRVQQQTGLAFSFNLIDPKVIDRMLDSKWSGENYSARIWKNTNALAQDLKEELLFNLITGRTERETAEIIANKYAVGAGKARRLVRTESCFVSSQIDMEGYEECGLERYRYLATLDLVTSDICRSLDGKVFLISEQTPGVNCPPMHPWCRSTTIAIIGDEELSELKRRARDPKTGKTYLISAEMAYEDWHKQYVKGHPEAELNEKMIKNRITDRKLFQKYKAVLKEKVPDSLDSFQEMKYTNSEKWKVLQEEMGLMRRSKNSGAFAHLPERMSKKHIRELAKEYDIGMDGLSITIDQNEELLRLPLAGRADPESIGGITFFPNAFKSKEELVRTLYHEKQHVLQYKEYGVEYVQNHRKVFEDLAYSAENEFIENLKKEGRL